MFYKLEIVFLSSFLFINCSLLCDVILDPSLNFLFFQLSLEFMSFTIDQKYYNQKQGLFLGAPTSPCFTEIYIQRVKKNHIYTMLNAPRLWYRKVDDTIAITSHDLWETLQKLNDIDENIKFTMEMASDGNLPFLDCSISLQEKREIITKVYRKPTHAGQYTHFPSNQPLHVKLSIIKTLIRRAQFICSDKTSLNKEISYIRETMQLNGYPLNAINKTTKETLQSHNFELKGKNWNHLKCSSHTRKVLQKN